FGKILVIGLPTRTDKRDGVALAAAFSGMDVEFIDGVTDVDPKTLPPGGEGSGRSAGEFGSWRAHMNAVKHVVEHNLESALIMEDDADWDVRIKTQMREFALATRALLQPVKGALDSFLDPSHPYGEDPKESAWIASELSLDDAARVEPPKSSPYGDIDRWDLLWPGHCGSGWPVSGQHQPLGRVVIRDDPTCPETQHIDPELGDGEYLELYPNHTRVVSYARNNLCILAYAVTQRGARKILYELGVREFRDAPDAGFRDMCHGEGRSQKLTCLTSQPQTFQQHRPAGVQHGYSDISGAWGGVNKEAYSKNIRQSVRANFEQLAAGSPVNDLLQDGAPGYVYTGLGGSKE
ncbi:glycosyltransferase family 25 protein, partial [Dothistroma septosporum NZE10]